MHLTYECKDCGHELEVCCRKCERSRRNIQSMLARMIKYRAEHQEVIHQWATEIDSVVDAIVACVESKSPSAVIEVADRLADLLLPKAEEDSVI